MKLLKIWMSSTSKRDDTPMLWVFAFGIGITFLLIALILSRGTPLTPSREEQLENMPLTLEITGVKPYHVGEEIRFGVNFEGSGNFCRAPYVQIVNEARTDVIWYFNGTDYSKGCNGQYTTIVQGYTFPGINSPPSTINQTGKYVIVIPFESGNVEQRFTVY